MQQAQAKAEMQEAGASDTRGMHGGLLSSASHRHIRTVTSSRPHPPIAARENVLLVAGGQHVLPHASAQGREAVQRQSSAGAGCNIPTKPAYSACIISLLRRCCVVSGP